VGNWDQFKPTKKTANSLKHGGKGAKPRRHHYDTSPEEGPGTQQARNKRGPYAPMPAKGCCNLIAQLPVIRSKKGSEGKGRPGKTSFPRFLNESVHLERALNPRKQHFQAKLYKTKEFQAEPAWGGKLGPQGRAATR